MYYQCSLTTSQVTEAQEGDANIQRRSSIKKNKTTRPRVGDSKQDIQQEPLTPIHEFEEDDQTTLGPQESKMSMTKSFTTLAPQKKKIREVWTIHWNTLRHEQSCRHFALDIFEMHSLWKKIMIFWLKFHEKVFLIVMIQSSLDQGNSFITCIGSGKNLAPNRWQAIPWISDDPVERSMCATRPQWVNWKITIDFMYMYIHVSYIYASDDLYLLHTNINSLWPSDAIWRQLSGSTLAQVMACCLTAPSHYLNQCWLIFKGTLWHSPVSNFIGIFWDTKSKNEHDMNEDTFTFNKFSGLRFYRCVPFISVTPSRQGPWVCAWGV